jgi:poly(3-hydroxybutyrate) depolymerase
VAFLSALIDDFVAKGADPRRVFVTGMSNGAFMAVTLVVSVRRTPSETG